MSRPKAFLSWSSGKDSAWTLHQLRRSGELDVVGLLTSVNQTHERVAMHAVRRKLLEQQAAAAGLALREVFLPHPCSNEIYERVMGEALTEFAAAGVEVIAFGDLFLEDVRTYRERQLEGTGLRAEFPLWGQPTGELAEHMLAAGLKATVTCVDPKQVARELAGRPWDRALLDELPEGVDPCGENGEFHTFVSDGPMFSRPVSVQSGEIVERGGFVFADLVPVEDPL